MHHMRCMSTRTGERDNEYLSCAMFLEHLGLNDDNGGERRSSKTDTWTMSEECRTACQTLSSRASTRSGLITYRLAGAAPAAAEQVVEAVKAAGPLRHSSMSPRITRSRTFRGLAAR